MSTRVEEKHLIETRPVTLIVRLVLNDQGVIVHGELVNLQGKSLSRFVGFRGLTRSFRKWLATLER